VCEYARECVCVCALYICRECVMNVRVCGVFTCIIEIFLDNGIHRNAL